MNDEFTISDAYFIILGLVFGILLGFLIFAPTDQNETHQQFIGACHVQHGVVAQQNDKDICLVNGTLTSINLGN